MENIYRVYNSFENCYIICHFDEISFWRIKSTDDTLSYFPYTREGKSLFGIVGDDGKYFYDRYLQYKNNK